MPLILNASPCYHEKLCLFKVTNRIEEKLEFRTKTKLGGISRRFDIH